MDTLITRPEIALDQFLPIFIESTLVLVFSEKRYETTDETIQD